MSSGDVSPQVIKRGDNYVIHNMDLDGYTDVQKIAVAVLAWDQVRMLMEASGQYRAADRSKIGSVGIGKTEDIDRAVAQMAGVKMAGLNTLRPRLARRPDVIEKMLSGEITHLADVKRAVGMKIRNKLTEGAHSKANPKNSAHYGKGDRFDEALEPLLRYLAAWKKRGFQYPHVPPRAAQKRVAALDEVIADLQKARADLETRSHIATLSVGRREDRRRENS